MNFSLSESRVLLRAVLLSGVLAGLLFSCGEGIRLFPFPPQAAPNKHSGLATGEAVGYQKNIHRFETKQENCRSKIQRDNEHHYLTNGYGAFYNTPFPRFSPARQARVLFNTRFFKSRLSAFLGAGRAPPFAS